MKSVNLKQESISQSQSSVKNAMVHLMQQKNMVSYMNFFQ